MLYCNVTVTAKSLSSLTCNVMTITHGLKQQITAQIAEIHPVCIHTEHVMHERKIQKHSIQVSK